MDDHLADQLGRQQGVADTATNGAGLVQYEPVARRNVVPVDQRLGQTRIGSPQTHAIIFVEATFVGAGGTDSDTRNALK